MIPAPGHEIGCCVRAVKGAESGDSSRCRSQCAQFHSVGMCTTTRDQHTVSFKGNASCQETNFRYPNNDIVNSCRFNLPTASEPLQWTGYFYAQQPLPPPPPHTHTHTHNPPPPATRKQTQGTLLTYRRVTLPR